MKPTTIMIIGHQLDIIIGKSIRFISFIKNPKPNNRKNNPNQTLVDIYRSPPLSIFEIYFAAVLWAVVLCYGPLYGSMDRYTILCAVVPFYGPLCWSMGRYTVLWTVAPFYEPSCDSMDPPPLHHPNTIKYF